MEIKILDKGFVKLVDIMGDDKAIAAAARVSYSGVSKGDDQDKKLLFYLMKHRHGSPFEHVIFKIHVKAPLFVTRQWMRHRIASYNEISYRYTETPDEYYIPTVWRKQDSTNKQGSVSDESLQHELLSQELKLICDESFNFYKRFLAKGVAREMARVILPVNVYTQFYWVVNARSLMNFINLRADNHAQEEMRKYAEAHAQIFQTVCPWTYEAFMKYGWEGESNVLDVKNLVGSL
jgi:thymidylate synthase (FAD)